MEQETATQNANVDVKVTRQPGCQVTFEVMVNPTATTAAYKQALKNVNKEVSIPGFRKGRAPDDTILQRFGKYVDQEWRDLVINTAFKESCLLTKTYPYNDRSLKRPDLKSCSQEEGAQVVFEFESEPEIPSVDPSAITLKREHPKELTEQDIEDALREIQLSHAEWEDVEGRSVQDGDFVDLDIVDLGSTPERPLCTDKRFEIVSKKIGTWLKKLIMGQEVGATVEGTSELEEGASDIKNFQPTRCRVTIKGIKALKNPEITDELATQVGLENLGQLRDAVRREMTQAAEVQARDKMIAQLEQKLLERNAFDIPSSLFEAERGVRVKGAIKALLDHGETEDSIKAREKEIEAEANEMIDRSLRLYFLVQQVVKEGQIGVSKQELMAEFSRQMFGTSTEERVVTPDMEPDEMRSRLVVKILTQKSLDYLLDQVKIED